MTTASRTSPIIALSGTLAPVINAASGTPRPSGRMWRLTPFFARSVGFGPVRSPLLAPSPRRCRGSSTSRRSRVDHRSNSAARDESPRTRRAEPNSSNAGGMSSPSRIRSAALSTDSLSSTGTGFRPSRLALRLAGGLPSASAAPQVSAARSDARERRAHRQTWLPQSTVDHTRADLSRGFRITVTASSLWWRGLALLSSHVNNFVSAHIFQGPRC
jgi:hypothetical protein